MREKLLITSIAVGAMVAVLFLPHLGSWTLQRWMFGLISLWPEPDEIHFDRVIKLLVWSVGLIALAYVWLFN